eukprot:468682-Prorocentrum_lima.AAC.1
MALLAVLWEAVCFSTASPLRNAGSVHCAQNPVGFLDPDGAAPGWGHLLTYMKPCMVHNQEA